MSAPRILVVEDNSTTRKMLRLALQSEGFSVIEAGDARSALQRLAQGAPDLVLQDLVLPDMDGIELVKRIRVLPEGANLPVLALSGFVSRLEEARAMEGTFTGFLVKPIEPSQLVEVIREYLPRTESATRRVGEGKLLVLADDDPVQLKLFRLQLCRLGFRVNTASDGNEALRLARENPPDGIVSDVLMPGLDGFELCLAVRNDSRLAGVPVVLLTSHYVEPEDRELARKVGASDLLMRAADSEQFTRALLARLSAEVPAIGLGPLQVDVLRNEHARRVIRQLERQTRLNAGLAQRFGRLASQLSVLSRVTEVLERGGDIAATLRDALEVCLDTAAISKGVLYLRNDAATLVVHHAIGFPSEDRKMLEGFFGFAALLDQFMTSEGPLPIPSSQIPEETSRALLSRAGLASALLVPLVSGGSRLGLLFLGSLGGDVTGEDLRAFFQALGAQIGQAVALTRTFQRLVESEQRFAAIFRSSPAPLGMATIEEGRMLDVNDRYAEMMAYQRVEMIGRTLAELRLWAEPEQRARLVKDLRQQGSVRDIACRFRRKSGEIFDALLSVERIDMPQGSFGLAMPLDVTERNRAEAHRSAQFAVTKVLSEALTFAEAAPRLLQVMCENLGWVFGALWQAEASSDQIVCREIWHPADARVTKFKEATRRLTFSPGSDIPGRIWSSAKPLWIEDLSADPILPRAPMAREESIRAGCGFPIAWGDRVVGVFEFFAHETRRTDQTLLKLMGDLGVQVGQFFSRKQAEEALAERARLNALSGDVGVALTQGGTLREVLQRCTEAMVRHLDAAFARVWSLNPEKNVLELEASAGIYTHLDGPHSRVPVGKFKIGLIAHEGRPHLTNDVPNDPGVDDREWARREGMISFAGHPLVVEGQLVGVMAMFARRPLTEFVQRALESVADGIALGIGRRRAEQVKEQLEMQLRQSQRMEAVGRLAGGIAHDFNNLLTVILGFANLALRELGEGLAERHKLEQIVKAGEHASSLTRQLLVFSRQQVIQPKILDLNLVVAETDKMLRRIIGEDVRLATAMAGDLGQVKADPGQIEQILVNLAVNSRDAMPDGGRLTIQTANVELSEFYAAQHADARPGRYVMLAVSDTGKGMDTETLSHIFEPFFTTKEPGKGTGLGLATVYGIVKQSNGHISVYSEPGNGTGFKIYLPRVDERLSEMPILRYQDPVPGGSETILLVEDESDLRALARTVLETQGYMVLEAESGAAAIELARSHAGPLDLILTDVVMPGMSGRQMCEVVATLQPGTRVLYMSGYTNDAIVHHGVLESGIAFLQKPFSPRELALAVREILDRPASTSAGDGVERAAV